MVDGIVHLVPAPMHVLYAKRDAHASERIRAQQE